jgi:tagatose-1,6-bisphosphate aldolase
MTEAKRTQANGGGGLTRIATDQDTFAIVAMDQRNTLKRMYQAVGISNPSSEELTALKGDTVQALRGTASAFLLDPTFGVPALSGVPQVGAAYGILVSAEPSERRSVDGEPRTYRDPAFDAKWVKEQGGDALKFQVSLRADRKAAPGKPDTVAEVLEVVRLIVADCRALGIPSVIENLIFPLAGEEPSTTRQKTDRIIEAAIALSELKPSLLKLEYPGDPESCRRLAGSISVPWAVLSAGVEFQDFASVVRISCDEGGTSGFIAGRSIWKDAIGMGREERRGYLANEGKRRLEKLVELINGRARAFTDV